jgi:hypothetical protein
VSIHHQNLLPDQGAKIRIGIGLKMNTGLLVGDQNAKNSGTPIITENIAAFFGQNKSLRESRVALRYRETLLNFQSTAHFSCIHFRFSAVDYIFHITRSTFYCCVIIGIVSKGSVTGNIVRIDEKL